MLKCFVFWFILAALCGIGKAQQFHRIMFYNVENLFDTFDDSVTRDDEFTPQGIKHWTKLRYISKLRSIDRKSVV